MVQSGVKEFANPALVIGGQAGKKPPILGIAENSNGFAQKNRKDELSAKLKFPRNFITSLRLLQARP